MSAVHHPMWPEFIEAIAQRLDADRFELGAVEPEPECTVASELEELTARTFVRWVAHRRKRSELELTRPAACTRCGLPDSADPALSVCGPCDRSL